VVGDRLGWRGVAGGRRALRGRQAGAGTLMWSGQGPASGEFIVSPSRFPPLSLTITTKATNLFPPSTTQTARLGCIRPLQSSTVLYSLKCFAPKKWSRSSFGGEREGNELCCAVASETPRQRVRWGAPGPHRRWGVPSRMRKAKGGFG